ncbi:hypothetical protein IV203_012574 [Nitzschia inconspicua]|uniref:Uncharacterized protein n=1 Tax=Nitzschia inconspicua TaxID=303405 RepID=A0A9K3PJF4_9STRA|nr:hypothetical protein IV203_012574 [Nitzschia inconspicua]
MGQSQSTVIQFEGTPFASIEQNGIIACKRSQSFTIYSSTSLTATDSHMTVHFKIHDTKNTPIAFGLLPSSSKHACRNAMVGQASIRGSIGCYIDRDTVSLYKEGSRFFCGEASKEAITSAIVSMEIQNGRLTFYVNGGKLISEELQDIKLSTGRYKFGVSMMKEGQTAEVFYGCPVSFKDCWSAGDVNGPTLLAKNSMKFTIFSEEAMKPQGRYFFSAHVLNRCQQPISFGVLPVECKEECQNNLVGLIPGTLACRIENDSVSVVKNGKQRFQTDMEIADSCIVTLQVDDGGVTFSVDGKKVGDERLDGDFRVADNFKVGVGLECEGQKVEIRGDGKSNGGIIPEEVDISALLLCAFEQYLRDQITADDLRWRDNMRSIDCDQTERIAVGVVKHTATIYTQRVVECEEDHSVDIRILKNSPVGEAKHDPLMMIGVVNDNPINHERHHLGAGGFPNSLGLSNRGDLLVDGEIIDSGLGFQEGDIVTMAFTDGNLSIKVNGIEAVTVLGRVRFSQKGRWAVSFSNEGQAVKIGSGELTQDENRFCIEKGVISSVKTTDASTVASNLSDTKNWSDDSSIDEDDPRKYSDVPEDVLTTTSPAEDGIISHSTLSGEYRAELSIEK